MGRERLVIPGKVMAVCKDGDSAIAATVDALHRIDRRGDVHLLTKIGGHYPLDLLVTDRAIFWTEQLHPMQAAWRRRACAVDRGGGEARALTGEMSFTAGFVREADVVIGVTLSALVRFSTDGRRRLDDVRVEKESRDEALDSDELADWKQLSAVAGGVHYEVREEGLVAAYRHWFWEWRRLLG